MLLPTLNAGNKPQHRETNRKNARGFCAAGLAKLLSRCYNSFAAAILTSDSRSVAR